jgi:hypothetical protein
MNSVIVSNRPGALIKALRALGIEAHRECTDYSGRSHVRAALPADALRRFNDQVEQVIRIRDYGHIDILA